MSSSSSPEGSVTRCLGDLRAGDPAAAGPLWQRYFDRLVRLARKRLAQAPGHGADADEEDAALSAFGSFCAGLARGKFPQLDGRDDLWRLLVVITARKASGQADRRCARKRGGGWTAAGDDPLDGLAGREPTPEFSAMVAEESHRLLERLGDDQLREIARQRMEGYSRDEIAARLGCARRTVARRLDLIRTIWLEEAS
jgi:DNA-directed RNA polymerase specialized sigma24 family protein